MASTTAVTIFHPVQDVEAFDAWLSELQASAKGALSTSVSVRDEPGLDWALAVTFASENLVHEWLDGADRRSVMEAGRTRGFYCRTTDLIITEGGDAQVGVSAFRHSLAAGKQADFLAVQSRLVAASSRFPGYEGTILLPDDTGDGWLTILRYRTNAQLSAWLRSTERDTALPGLRSSLTKGFSAVSSTTPFATTVRFQGDRTLMTPNWKSAMLVMLVLYPTVMLLSRFFVPLVEHTGVGPWLALWISQVASVSALQWFLMPQVTRPFRTWLDPVDGKGLRISAIGAAVVIVGYGLSLALFASVRWLQFWDYAH